MTIREREIAPNVYLPLIDYTYTLTSRCFFITDSAVIQPYHKGKIPVRLFDLSY